MVGWGMVIGAPPVIRWFIIPLTIDISSINHSMVVASKVQTSAVCLLFLEIHYSDRFRAEVTPPQGQPTGFIKMPQLGTTKMRNSSNGGSYSCWIPFASVMINTCIDTIHVYIYIVYQDISPFWAFYTSPFYIILSYFIQPNLTSQSLLPKKIQFPIKQGHHSSHGNAMEPRSQP